MGYYYISKYRERAPGTEGAAGRIIMPSGVQQAAIERRHIRPRQGQMNMLEPLAAEPAALEAALRLRRLVAQAFRPAHAPSFHCSLRLRYFVLRFTMKRSVDLRLRVL